jgi:hypothetical protein
LAQLTAFLTALHSGKRDSRLCDLFQAATTLKITEEALLQGVKLINKRK